MVSGQQMAIELLIKARNTHGSYKKGHVIYVKNQPCVWGIKEGLSNFIQVVITNATKAEVRQYWATQWKVEYDYEVLNHNVVQDGYRIRLFSVYVNVSGENSITREQVENYLNKWNAIFRSASQNEVVFDFGIYESATSENFWGDFISDVIFNQISYDQQTGIHIIDADYSAIEPHPTQIKVEQRVAGMGAIIVSHDTQNRIITFSVDRDLVILRLKRAFIDVLDGIFEERQFYIDSIAVDNIVAQGGRIEVSKAQAITYIRNRMDE